MHYMSDAHIKIARELAVDRTVRTIRKSLAMVEIELENDLVLAVRIKPSGCDLQIDIQHAEG